MTFTDKYIRANGVVEAAGRRMKCYHLSSALGQIAEGIQEAAYAFLPSLLPEPDAETPAAGWAILHKGDGAPAYVIAYSWIWVNVVECRAAIAGVPELGSNDENPNHFEILDRPWAGCVWELAPLEHERSAWIHHVLEPKTPDLDGYLTDMLPDGTSGAQR